MSSPAPSAEEELRRLRARNAELEAELNNLRAAAKASEHQAAQEQQPPDAAANGASQGDFPPAASWDGLQHGLDKDQIARYSRQIILHSFGVQGTATPCPACSFLLPVQGPAGSSRELAGLAVPGCGCGCACGCACANTKRA